MWVILLPTWLNGHKSVFPCKISTYLISCHTWCAGCDLPFVKYTLGFHLFILSILSSSLWLKFCLEWGHFLVFSFFSLFSNIPHRFGGKGCKNFYWNKIGYYFQISRPSCSLLSHIWYRNVSEYIQVAMRFMTTCLSDLRFWEHHWLKNPISVLLDAPLHYSEAIIPVTCEWIQAPPTPLMCDFIGH